MSKVACPLCGKSYADLDGRNSHLQSKHRPVWNAIPRELRREPTIRFAAEWVPPVRQSMQGVAA